MHDGHHVAVGDAWQAQRGQGAGGNEKTAGFSDEPPHSDTATLSASLTCVCLPSDDTHSDSQAIRSQGPREDDATRDIDTVSCMFGRISRSAGDAR